MPNVTSETDRKWCFWLLFPLAAAMTCGHLYIRSPNGKTQWKKSPPGSKTPCLWRTEKPQNCTSKMPNVTSETDRKWCRKWCFWLLFPLAAAMTFGHLYIQSPNGKTSWKKSPPGSKTPCLWRTEKPQNCTKKMPNVTSETDRKWCRKWCFWLLFPLAAAMTFGHLYIRSPNGKAPWKKSPPGSKTPCLWRTEKPQNCTSKMPNVTSETDRKWCFWFLFPLAAAMTPGSKTPCLWRTEKPQNCTSKMPNVTPETHRTWWWIDAFGCFFSLLLLLWILATFSACCCRGFCFCCCCCWSSDGNTPWKKSPPGSKTPCLWRTEKPQNCTSKMPNVTSETDRKWCFWLLFRLAAAMTFGHLWPGPQTGKHHGKNHLPAAKHHASEGRRSPEIAPRKCLT